MDKRSNLVFNFGDNYHRRIYLDLIIFRLIDCAQLEFNNLMIPFFVIL